MVSFCFKKRRGSILLVRSPIVKFISLSVTSSSQRPPPFSIDPLYNTLPMHSWSASVLLKIGGEEFDVSLSSLFLYRSLRPGKPLPSPILHRSASQHSVHAFMWSASALIGGEELDWSLSSVCLYRSFCPGKPPPSPILY